MTIDLTGFNYSIDRINPLDKSLRHLESKRVIINAVYERKKKRKKE